MGSNEVRRVQQVGKPDKVGCETLVEREQGYPVRHGDVLICTLCGQPDTVSAYVQGLALKSSRLRGTARPGGPSDAQGDRHVPSQRERRQTSVRGCAEARDSWVRQGRNCIAGRATAGAAAR